MKRIFAIALIFIHLFSAVGFSMSIHYCGSHKSYSFFGIEVGTICGCDHNDHQHSKDCCKDKKVEVKAQKKENISSKVITLNHTLLYDFIPLPTYSFKTKISIALTNSFTVYAGHPPNHSPPLYLLNRAFLI